MKLFMMSYQEPGNKKKEDGEILVGDFFLLE
jgi:hypothetical protein